MTAGQPAGRHAAGGLAGPGALHAPGGPVPDARTVRPATAPPLDAALEQIAAAPAGPAAVQDPLAAAGGVFVGRDDLFYQLESAARLQRVVVLSGPGGTGKTELAKGFARWWRDTGGVDDPRLVLWYSFEPGVATFGLDGVITALGLEVFGADFARLEAPQRLDAVRQLMTQYRMLLVWDNFESVKEMPDPVGASPPVDAAGCAALKEFLDWVRDHSASSVILTSRAAEDWLGPVRRVAVGGLNQAEAAAYAGRLLAPFPAAQARRERRSFGELLEWLDGHPLAMRLILPCLDTAEPETLLDRLKGITPLPGEPEGTDRGTSLDASITYSFLHLPSTTRRLLPAVCLFQAVTDVLVLETFSAMSVTPKPFAGVSLQDWKQAFDDAARVGLLTPLFDGQYQVHPALPTYLAARWRAEDPENYESMRDTATLALALAYGFFCLSILEEIRSGDAGYAYTTLGLQRRTLGVMLSYTLDHQIWPFANVLISALESYWEARRLDGEASAWADQVQLATELPDSSPPAQWPCVNL